MRAAAAGPLLALARSCHPLPTLVVTAVLTGIGALAGTTPGRLVLLACAVLAGQLSIGWSNDALDARRDSLAGRSDKPLATGQVHLARVARAAALAASVCVGLSLWLGLLPGLAHLIAVAAGWAYNLGLKNSVWSWAPYAVGFGLFPAAAALCAPDVSRPPVWLVAAGASLGVAAHLANVLPDLADDAATGVRGLPHRLSIGSALALTGFLLIAATGALSVGLRSRGPLVSLGPLVLAAAAVSVLPLARSSRRSGLAFRLVLGIAVMDVALLLLAGSTL